MVGSNIYLITNYQTNKKTNFILYYFQYFWKNYTKDFPHTVILLSGSVYKIGNVLSFVYVEPFCILKKMYSWIRRGGGVIIIGA